MPETARTGLEVISWEASDSEEMGLEIEEDRCGIVEGRDDEGVHFVGVVVFGVVYVFHFLWVFLILV